MHQPPDIFSLLVENQMGRLVQIINSYQMPLKYLDSYRDSLKIHVGFSGILLEQLLSREVIDACRKVIDIPLMLNEYRESKNVEIIGLGYSHPIFPLIPSVDWNSQIAQGREIIREVFGQEPKGFWPSGRGFCPQMIPVLKKYGYEYVILDRSIIKPGSREVVKGRHGREHYSTIGNLTYQGIEIGAVLISKGFDHLQNGDSPLEPSSAHPYSENPSGQRQRNPLVVDWLFIDELTGRRTAGEPEDCEFWEGCFSPYLERIYKAGLAVRGVLLREFLHDMKVRHLMTVRQGSGFAAGSQADDGHSASIGRYAASDRARAIEDVWQLSQLYHEVKSALLRKADRSLCQEYLSGLLEKAEKWLLKSQTDCYFAEDGPWAARLYDNIKPGLILLKEIKRQVL